MVHVSLIIYQTTTNNLVYQTPYWHQEMILMNRQLKYSIFLTDLTPERPSIEILIKKHFW